MASVSITRRRASSGVRYVVRFRLGGRAYPIVHGGSFMRERDAKGRRDFIAGELAAGRNPADALRAMVEQPARVVTLSAWFDRFIESRIDVGEKAKALYKNARNKLGVLADRDPATLRPSDIQTWIADNKKLAPKTVRHYLSTVRQVLDFAEVEPNPARSPRVKIPTLARKEPTPPSRAEWDALLEKLGPKIVLPARLMECCGLRLGEARELQFGDIDFTDGRIRISKERTKGGTAGQRWLPVPDELLDEIDALVPLEDRYAGRSVFSLTEGQIRGAIERACNLAKIAHYHPHDLRHRRISLWVAHGIDAVTVKTWAGHSNASMSLDTYAHVVIDREKDEWRDFWRDAYGGERTERMVR